VEGHELTVSCSVGIAVYPEDGSDIDELMRRADAAMYEAKTTGRDMALFYSAETDQRALARQTMEQHLRRALERQELSLHYQPRLAAKGGSLLGVEALLRWSSPALGHIPPSEFIPIAEETGMIRAIGGWVLQQACEQWAQWQMPLTAGQHHPLPHPLANLSISVNLSAAQLADPLLVSDIEDLLTRTGMPAHRLELEITESQLMDNAHAAELQLAALKALGVQLSIDDFGTGYSSLAYLKRFDIDRLKVDKSFVHDMLGNPADMAITRAIIALGHTLGLKIVAEGVEDLASAQVLSALDCEELQGYHFSRPLPPQALLSWAVQHRAQHGASLRGPDAAGTQPAPLLG
jgi:EAL domain-containing protein (putative c-di-GMP-specific phosphodiesterase class I)